MFTPAYTLKNMFNKKNEECSAKKISRRNWTRKEIETLITLQKRDEILHKVSLSDHKDKKSAAVKQNRLAAADK